MSPEELAERRRHDRWAGKRPRAGGAPGPCGRDRTVRIAVRGDPVRGGAVGRPMAGSRPRGARHVGATGDIKRHRLRKSSNPQAVKTQ